MYWKLTFVIIYDICNHHSVIDQTNIQPKSTKDCQSLLGAHPRLPRKPSLLDQARNLTAGMSHRMARLEPSMSDSMARAKHPAPTMLQSCHAALAEAYSSTSGFSTELESWGISASEPIHEATRLFKSSHAVWVRLCQMFRRRPTNKPRHPNTAQSLRHLIRAPNRDDLASSFSNMQRMKRVSTETQSACARCIGSWNHTKARHGGRLRVLPSYLLGEKDWRKICVTCCIPAKHRRCASQGSALGEVPNHQRAIQPRMTGILS